MFKWKKIFKFKNNLIPNKNKNKRNKKNKRSKSISNPNYLSDSELFTSGNGSFALFKEIYKMNNKEIDINFEINIRQILEIFYGCKKIAIKRKLLYHKIV